MGTMNFFCWRSLMMVVDDDAPLAADCPSRFFFVVVVVSCFAFFSPCYQREPGGTHHFPLFFSRSVSFRFMPVPLLTRPRPRPRPRMPLPLLLLPLLPCIATFCLGLAGLGLLGWACWTGCCSPTTNQRVYRRENTCVDDGYCVYTCFVFRCFGDPAIRHQPPPPPPRPRFSLIDT